MLPYYFAGNENPPSWMRGNNNNNNTKLFMNNLGTCISCKTDFVKVYVLTFLPVNTTLRSCSGMKSRMFSCIDFTDIELTLFMIWWFGPSFLKLIGTTGQECIIKPKCCRSSTIMQDQKLCITASTCIPAPNVVMAMHQQKPQCWIQR